MNATHVWDPDIGPVEIIDFPAADKKRWTKAENTGAWLAYPEDGAPEYHEVFLLELSGRFRFVARGGKQYGPELSSLVAAIYFAYGHGWLDPETPFERNVKCMVEMRSNTRSLKDRDFDAWKPMESSARPGGNPHPRDNGSGCWPLLRPLTRCPAAPTTPIYGGCA